VLVLHIIEEQHMPHAEKSGSFTVRRWHRREISSKPKKPPPRARVKNKNHQNWIDFIQIF